MGQHLFVLINSQTHGMVVPHCWFKVCSFDMTNKCETIQLVETFNSDLGVFCMAKMMEGGWIQMHCDVA